SGAVGGGASGTIYGVAEWDSNLSFADNMSRIAKAAGTRLGVGAAGAPGFATLFKAGSKGLQAIGEHYKLKSGEKLSDEQLDEIARMVGGEDARAQYNDKGDIEVIREKGKAPGDGAIAPHPTTDGAAPAGTDSGR